MMDEQLVPAFMAALLGEGVSAQQIEGAVARVRDVRLGQCLSSLAGRPAEQVPMVRAFTFEQAQRLKLRGSR